MVGQLNFYAFRDGKAITFHTAENIYAGFIKVNAEMRVRNTVAGEEPDGFIANDYVSGAENVTVNRTQSVVNMPFDAAGTVSQKIVTGNRGMARGCNGYTSGESLGVCLATAVSGGTGKVWLTI
jgi:hypothetical protein